MIKIPKFFHEIFGETQSNWELLMIFDFVFFSGLLLAFFTKNQWGALSPLGLFFLVLLFLDISGGVIANLTAGTNAYYQSRPKARLVFIGIHVQPLLLAWVMGGGFKIAVILWLYTVCMAFLANALRNLPFHRGICGYLTAIGLLIAAFEPNVLLRILYLFYVIKVLYNFSVDHANKGGTDEFSQHD